MRNSIDDFLSGFDCILGFIKLDREFQEFKREYIYDGSSFLKVKHKYVKSARKSKNLS